VEKKKRLHLLHCVQKGKRKTIQWDNLRETGSASGKMRKTQRGGKWKEGGGRRLLSTILQIYGVKGGCIFVDKDWEKRLTAGESMCSSNSSWQEPRLC
jgi:hypothetical protein